MAIEPGTVMCLKTTGELVVILSEDEDRVEVRRPQMTHYDGIIQKRDDFYAFELETIEAHLRREAREMILKIEIQEEIMGKMEEGKRKKLEQLVN